MPDTLKVLSAAAMSHKFVLRLAVVLLLGFTALIADAAAQTPDELNSLSATLSNGSSEQKRDALSRIRLIATPEASILAVSALKDADEAVRATAAASAVFAEPEIAVNALLPLLDDRSPFVRRESAYALGIVGSELASQKLIRTFENDKDLEVRAAAAIALGSSGGVNAIPALTALLQKKPSENTEFLRRSAARSIGQVAQIKRSHEKTIVTPSDFLPEKFKTKAEPGEADITERYPQFILALKVLTTVLANRSESDDTRREAAFALGSIGSFSSTAALRANLNGSDPYLAEISKEALLKLTPQPIGNK